MTETPFTREGPWALDALGAELARVEPDADRASRLSSAPRFRIAIALLVVGGLLIGSFTPPGRAIAGDIGRLVGIGDPATTDHSDAPVPTKTEPLVIDTGETPGGVAYEMVTFVEDTAAVPGPPIVPPGVIPDHVRSDAKTVPVAPSEGSQASPPGRFGTAYGGSGPICFTLDYPAEPRPFGTNACSGAGMTIPFGNPGFNEARHAGPGVSIQMEGLTGEQVDPLAVSYQNPQGERVGAPVAFGRIEGDLVERMGTRTEMGYYVAFLPADQFPGFDAPAMSTLQIAAYDEAGSLIKELDYGPIYEEIHARTLAVECMRDAMHAREEGTALDLPEIQEQCGWETTGQ
jgi:hypothetical protein